MARKKRLPRPSKGRELTTDQKIRIAESVCNDYATDQFTLRDVLSHYGIKSTSTWHKWREEIEDIETLYKAAKIRKEEVYDERLVERSLTSLERMVQGYTILTEELEGVDIEKDGETQFIISKKKLKQTYVQPKLGAVTFVLTNRRGDLFTRNPEPPPTLDGRPDNLNIIIVGGEIPPVTSEDDIIDPTGTY